MTRTSLDCERNNYKWANKKTVGTAGTVLNGKKGASLNKREKGTLSSGTLGSELGLVAGLLIFSIMLYTRTLVGL